MIREGAWYDMTHLDPNPVRSVVDPRVIYLGDSSIKRYRTTVTGLTSKRRIARWTRSRYSWIFPESVKLLKTRSVLLRLTCSSTKAKIGSSFLTTLSGNVGRGGYPTHKTSSSMSFFGGQFCFSSAGSS